MSTPVGGTRQILNLVASKWTIPVVRCLVAGQQRPSELLERLPGLSQKVLTQTLRRLEHGGLVARVAHATAPPRVDYQLTSLGHSLLEPLDVLDHWLQKHGQEIDSGVFKPRKSGKKDQAKSRVRRPPK